MSEPAQNQPPQAQADQTTERSQPAAGAPQQAPPAAAAGQYAPPAAAPPAGQYPPPGGPPPPGQYPAQGAPPAGQYPPPAGAPGQYPPPPGAPPAGQYPPPGQYAPPAGAAPGQYPPPPGAPGTPGQQPPPAGAAGAAPGQYPPPPGAPGQYGQYPGYPPQGAYPPPAGHPGYAPAYGGYPGYGAPGQPPAPYYPQYNPYAQPPYGQYPPPSGAPGAPGAPPAAPGTPAAPAVPGQAAPAYPAAPGGFPGYPGAPPQAPYGAAPAMPGYPSPAGGVHAPSGLPVWYLGTQIVDPATPTAPLGATKVLGYNPEPDYNNLMRFASTGLADELKVWKIISSLNIAQRDALNDFSVAKSGRDLTGYVDAYIASDCKYIFRGLVQGPLGYDVELLRKALQGIGTNEMLLTELILNRPTEELRLLIAEYKRKNGRDLIEAVKSDLSGKLERMFVMALNCQRTPDSVPVDQKEVDLDVSKLARAASTKEELPFIEIFVNRSHPHLAQVITTYGRKHKSLSKVIKKTFSGDLERALLYILHGVKAKRDGQGIWRDAKLFEATMAGLGTKDTQLIYRTIRAHWNAQRFEAIKAAYLKRYGKTLERRVKGETSGPYREVMLMIITANEPK